MVETCKLIYVVESFATGVYSVIRDVVNKLDATKFEVIVIYSLRPETPEELLDDFRAQNVRLIYVPMHSVAECAVAILRINTILRKEKPSVVHLHSSKAGIIGRLACRLARVNTIIYSPHGFSFLKQDIRRLFQKLFFFIEFCASRIQPCTILAVSKGEQEQAERLGDDTRKIDNFVNQPLLQTVSSSGCIESRDIDSIVIGTAGRIAPQKNPDLFNLLAQSFLNVSFVWIGDGACRDKLTSPNITITGYLSVAKAWSAIKGLDVYIQTSSWEGMPICILEAMALGKPVIASNIMGNREVVIHGKTGYLASTTADFLHYIKHLCDNSELREQMGVSSADYIERKHDINQAVKQYSELYLNLANGNTIHKTAG